MIGREVSHYKIVEKIGEGGMGVVFKAEDTRLKRLVALKFLPADMTANSDAVARFEREAQATAALNHPNIITIYDVGEFEGRVYICMEYVEGETLAILLAGGPLSVERAVEMTAGIGEGLAAAHRAGVVHRDVKPENIIIGGEGEVKILDFGLAILRGVSRLTKESSTVGTVAYMSPELTKGGEVDQRTDVWSLGVVLYEMVAGRAPFAGDYEQAVAYAIVNEAHQPLGAVAPNVPGTLNGIVDKAMAKKPEERYQSADQMTADLKSMVQPAATDGQTGRMRVRPAARGHKKIFAGVAVVALVAAAMVAWQGTRRGGEAPPGEPQGETGSNRPLEMRQVTFAGGLEEYPTLAPDGSRVAYCMETGGFKQLFVKDLSTGDERQITRSRADNIQPEWSPDATTIAFVRSSRTDGKLEPGDVFGEYSDGDVWRHDLETGTERKVLDGAFNPAFSPDGGRIAVDASWAGTRRIWIADHLGRNAQQVTSDNTEAVSHLDPDWSPDGTRIVFLNKQGTKFDVKVVDLETRDLSWVTEDLHQDINPVWSPSGKNIYFSSKRGGGMNVWRVPVRAEGTPIAPPQQVTTGAGEDVQLALANDGGTMALSILGINADLWALPVSVETGLPTGKPQKLVATTREDSRGAWAPDGRRIAFNSDRSGDMNIWVYSLDDGTSRQITTGAGGDFQANWSPDGTTLAFFSSRAGNADIWAVDVATGALTQLTDNLSLEINPFFSPDGASIAYQSDRDGRLEVWVVDTDGTNHRRLTNIGASGHFMRWSPDGAYVIFRSPQGGAGQLYRVAAAGGDPEPFSIIAGGAHISFSPTHDAILDVLGHKKMWLTPVPDGEPQLAFEFDDPDIRIDYPEWSPDGAWILFDRIKPGGGDIWLIHHFE